MPSNAPYSRKRWCARMPDDTRWMGGHQGWGQVAQSASNPSLAFHDPVLPSGGRKPGPEPGSE